MTKQDLFPFNSTFSILVIFCSNKHWVNNKHWQFRIRESDTSSTINNFHTCIAFPHSTVPWIENFIKKQLHFLVMTIREMMKTKTYVKRRSHVSDTLLQMNPRPVSERDGRWSHFRVFNSITILKTCSKMCENFALIFNQWLQKFGVVIATEPVSFSTLKKTFLTKFWNSRRTLNRSHWILSL